MNKLEQDIVTLFHSTLKDNLITLLAVGSYGTNDIVDGYSDCDLMVFVENIREVKTIDLGKLSKKYSIDIGYSLVSYSDFKNRTKNNNKSTRFVGNIDLIKIRKQSRVLYGKNIINLTPTIKEVIRRDLGVELRASYYHATSMNPDWNIFKRKPRKWVNYIINMSNDLLLVKGVIVKKNDIPAMLKKHCPDFCGLSCVVEAVRLRRTKEILSLNKLLVIKLKNTLCLFLEEYRGLVFYNH